MRARRPREGERGAPRDADVRARERPRRNADPPARQVEGDDADRDNDDGDDEPAPGELEDGKREEVEADVAPEDRVAHAERDGVEPAQQRIPLVTARDSEKERWNEKQPHVAERRPDRAAAAPVRVYDHAGHLRPQREIQVRKREDEEQPGEREERPEPRGVPAEIHVLETEAAEPEEIGEEADHRTDKERDDQKNDEHERDEDRSPRGTGHARPATESGEVDVRPVDASPVAPAIAATPALAHSVSAYSANVRSVGRAFWA